MHLPPPKLLRDTMSFPVRRRTLNSKTPPVAGMNKSRPVSIARLPKPSIHRTFGTRQNAGFESIGAYLALLCCSLVLPSR
ncbi:hypothetical protein SS05631_b51230 (plasmid) [Sinorhizobium sp. CCBAU 05631]|nr:hypothetical protein SS05631_b51230 [Sinorhizobium sp. CCBAU 05631]